MYTDVKMQDSECDRMLTGVTIYGAKVQNGIFVLCTMMTF